LVSKMIFAVILGQCARGLKKGISAKK